MTEHLKKLLEVLTESNYRLIHIDKGYPYAYMTNMFGEIIHPEARFNIGRLLDDAELQYIKSKSEWDVDEMLKQNDKKGTEQRWIPVSERLPEEKVNPITFDYYEYPVTVDFAGKKDIRYYKYGKGHWWHGSGIMDERVLAWMPLPEPYMEDENDK